MDSGLIYGHQTWKEIIFLWPKPLHNALHSDALVAICSSLRDFGTQWAVSLRIPKRSRKIVETLPCEMCNAFDISSTLIRLSEYFVTYFFISGIWWRPDLVSSSKDVLLRLNSPTQNLTCAYDGAEDPSTLVSSQCISWPVFPFKYKYRITARYSTFDEKLAFASLAMFDSQYLMSEWHDKGAMFISSVSSLSFLFLFLPRPSLSSPLLSLFSLFWEMIQNDHKGWRVVKP